MSTPFAALHDIYRLWRPQTDASLEQRLDVLDLLRDRHPEVAWRLLLAVVPEPHDVATPTSRPEWREWGQSDTPVTRQMLAEGTHEVVRRLREDVGTDGLRWAGLLGRIDDLPSEEYDTIAQRLLEISTRAFDDESRTTIWTALRKVLSHHLAFPDAEWALAEDHLRPLMAAYASLEPDDPEARLAWLFSPNPDLPVLTTGGWRERQIQVESAQRDAIYELIRVGGIDEVLGLIPVVESPWTLGQATARANIDLEEEALLHYLLRGTDERQKEFARAFLRARIQSPGQPGVERILGETARWEPPLRAEVLAALPFSSETWEVLDRENEATRDAYWALVPYVGRGQLERNDVERVARGLAGARRLFEALDFSAMYAANVSTGVVMEILEMVPQDPPADTQSWTRVSYEVGQLLALVQTDSSISEDRLAAAEWFFLPFLVRGHGSPEPKVLHRRLARDPDFFLTVLSLVYRENPEESPGTESTPESDEGDRGSSSGLDETRARMAYELLRTWRTFPGETDEGSIDASQLRAWVIAVRDRASAARRRRIADERIGELLASSPVGNDGAWPHESVRAILETTSTSETDEGFFIGILNSRGVTSRELFEGGVQERNLASQYADFATALRDRWPRTSSLLMRVARQYEAEARREDTRTELRDWEH